MLDLQDISDLALSLPVTESGFGFSNLLPSNASTNLGILLKPKQGNLGAKILSIEESSLEASNLLQIQSTPLNGGNRNAGSVIPSRVQLPGQKTASVSESSGSVEQTQDKDELTGFALEDSVVGSFNTLSTQDLENTESFYQNFSLNSDVDSLEKTAPIKYPLLGIYYGNQGWEMNKVQVLESWQGKKHAVVNLFTDWKNNQKTISNLFDQQLPNIWNNQNIPMITWEPLTAGRQTPDDIEVRIGNGQHDSYIHNWAEQLKNFLSGEDGEYGTDDDRRAYLRFAHEMNGDWYQWGAARGNNTPEQYVQMWQHTKKIFDGKGIDETRLQWVWNVNHTDIGGFKAEAFYPGDDYVDWVAIDGYNWGATQSWSTWQTPAEVFGPMIERMKALTDKPKPIAITEVGTTSLVGPRQNDIAAKSAWITDFLNYSVDNDVKMVVWFNEDKETDWAVFGGSRGDSTFKPDRTTSYRNYSAYRTGVQSPSYIGFYPTDPPNPRLFTDESFMGLMA